MQFVPTADLPKYPDTWRGHRPEMPLPHYTDADIDQGIAFILAKGATINDIPTSQLGRRVALATYIALEQGKPIDQHTVVPTPFKAGQPR